MSLPPAVADCSVCPRLCRDVCPVAVHGFRDDFIPSEKMRAVAGVLGHSAGMPDPERLLACTDCGACTAYCLLSVPVAPWLDHAASLLKLEGRVDEARANPVSDVPSIGLDELGADALFLPTCTEKQATAHLASKFVRTGDRQTPAPGTFVHGSVEFAVHKPALGSTCCGSCLHTSVGDPGIRARMARAMVAHLPPGTATIYVQNARCAAHIEASADAGLRVMAVTGEPAAQAT